MYIYLRNNIVWEFVPEENPELPGVPLEERYPEDFVSSLIKVDDIASIGYGDIYDPKTKKFSNAHVE